MIKVSIIVATYKRDFELKRALISLATQTYEAIEIVIVDDNARTEWNTKVSQIVEEFKNDFPNIEIKYIVNKDNQGSARTRNIGINASTGKYITFLDDDDVYLPDKVKNQVEFMEKDNYDFSITDLNLYNSNDKLINKRIRSYIKDYSTISLIKYHLKYHLTGTDTMMFSKEYINKIGGFPPINVGDEFYLMQRAVESNGKFGYLPRCDVKAYVHTGVGGLSSGDGKIEGENILYEYKRTFFDRLSSKDIRYIKMRHYAVIAFAYLRMKKPIPFLMNGIASFFAAPVQCINLLKSRKAL